MKRKLLLVTLCITVLLAAASFSLTVDRLRMDYTDNGVYFDEETLTTYDSQAVIFYVGITVALSVVAVILIVKLFSTRGRYRDNDLQ